MRSFRVCSPVFVAAFVGVSGAAHAGLSSNMAATCSVGDPAIQNNLYTIASGSVRHQTGKTGVITLYCPIAPTINIGGGSHGGWFMTFVDPDGAANNYYIESQIIRSDQSGHVNAVSGVLSSNSPSPTNYIERALNHTYDFANFYYYVRVNLFGPTPPPSRSSTGWASKAFPEMPLADISQMNSRGNKPRLVSRRAAPPWRSQPTIQAIVV